MLLQQGSVLAESPPAGSNQETIYKGTSKCLQRLEMKITNSRDERGTEEPGGLQSMGSQRVGHD